MEFTQIEKYLIITFCFFFYLRLSEVITSKVNEIGKELLQDRKMLTFHFTNEVICSKIINDSVVFWFN